MKELEYNKPINTLYVKEDDYCLKVFRVGANPHLAERSEYDPKTMQGIHTHFTYEVFFVTSGKLKLITEYDTREFQNTILIIPPKLKHFSVPIHGDSFCLLFSFEARCEAETNIIKLTNNYICELPLTEEISFYIKMLSKKTEENTPASENDATHLTSLIFNGMFASINPKFKNDEKSNKRTFQHINAIEAFINQNINKKLTLSDISKCVYLSEKQISRIIEKEYGCTFSQLITDKRLAKVAILLKNTDMKISEIAAKTFYGTESYFYTVFKNKYGMSPLQYRKNMR